MQEYETKTMNDEDGNRLGEMRYKNGIADGLCRLWYKSGQLHQESHFTSGVLNGAFRTWWENGTLKEETLFEWGVKISSKHYDADGKLVSEYNGQVER